MSSSIFCRGNRPASFPFRLRRGWGERRRVGGRLGWVGVVAMALAVAFEAGGAEAWVPRAMPAGELPHDIRLEPLKDLDGYFPFAAPESTAAWAGRSERVRRQVQVALGLWPMPTRTPLNAVVLGRREMGDYIIENVSFESLPGFFVTGNLYRPATLSGKAPGMLCPHGHWPDGRFMDAGVEAVRKEIVQGAERFEDGGRSPLQSRCVQLARMGCVVFHYDMIGYADSQQISQAIAHGFSRQRPEMNTPTGWGLFSPRAESWYQSVMGLQTWNSIRALDFLCGLPEVDVERIGCTGASGGGTQTFILAALDSRVKLAFPAVMVSTAMQGGCTCENACGLRIGTGNVEFAALFAPGPLGMTTANDWTREFATKGFPALQALYELYGASDQVMLKRGEWFGHNYNYVSRAALYSWVNRGFKLGLPEPVVEAGYRRLTGKELSVWTDSRPAPEGGPEFERRLLRWLTEDTRAQLSQAGATPEGFRQVVGGAVPIVLGRDWPVGQMIQWAPTRVVDRGTHREMVGRLQQRSAGEEIPMVMLVPANFGGRVVVWLDPLGKAGLFATSDANSAGGLRPEIRHLIDRGIAVAGVDLFMQGEFLGGGPPVTRTRRVKNPREAAAYTFGYNHSLFAQRVHDAVTALAFLESERANPDSLLRPIRSINLVGLGEAGPWAVAARALGGAVVRRAVIDTGGFRFGAVADLGDPAFLPGGAKYFDLPGMIALGAPGALLLAGEGATPQQLDAVIRTAYGAAPARLELVESADGAVLAGRAVRWLAEGGE